MNIRSLFGQSANLALDLGNNNVIASKDARSLSSLPSFIAVNKNTNKVRAFGEQAYAMLGKTDDNFKVIKPLKGGVIADFEAASHLLGMMVKHTITENKAFYRFNQIVCGVPYATTEVERRALRDALSQFRSRKTWLLFEPIAAAIGMGLNVQEPDGKFLVDIGGGITEIALISLSGIVLCRSLKVAGDSFDEDIQEYLRKKYNLAIGVQQAERLKINVGVVLEDLQDAPEAAYVSGKDVSTGIPRKVKITPAELAYVLNESITKIEDAILRTLDECPPELAGDVFTNGIFLTGGSSLLRGLKERLEAKVKIPIHADPHALHSVSKGISSVLQSEKHFQALLFN
jgi:rod shape-determining protein MreB